MKTQMAISCLLAIVLASTFGVVRGNQTSDDSEKLIKSARFLEEKPLDKDAKGIRSWAITWIIQTDKVSVKMCSTMLLDKKYKYGSELLGQYTIAMAAFKLANVDRSGDEDAAQLAGIESALVAYEAMLKVQPKAQNGFMDDLVARRANGTLAQYVKEANCKDKK
jgi:hypothetical protein